MKESDKDVVVITGGSAGVGRAIGKEFAKHGARLVLLARGKERLADAKRELEDLGAEVITFSVDVANHEQMETAAALVEEKWGQIDVWVNNAMVGVLSPVSEMKPEEYKRVTEVTYLGQVYGTQVALKRMLPRDKGSIVFVGSALAYRGIPLQSAYCAAKHASMGFYDSLRTELMHEKSNVKVSMVHLPAMNTPQFEWMRNKLPNKPRPMGQVYQPEVAARSVYYAAYHDVRELKVASSTLEAVIGNKLFPFIGDWRLAKEGFGGQQTPEPVDPNQKDNLFEPAPGLYGAHGTFDEEAKDTSATGWLGRNRSIPMAAAALAGIALSAFIWKG